MSGYFLPFRLLIHRITYCYFLHGCELFAKIFQLLDLIRIQYQQNQVIAKLYKPVYLRAIYVLDMTGERESKVYDTIPLCGGGGGIHAAQIIWNSVNFSSNRFTS